MIRTERLLLRRWRGADRDPFAAMNADPAVTEQRVMERIGLVRDPSSDFDHPRVDPMAYPQLVRHVLYRLGRDQWAATATARR